MDGGPRSRHALAEDHVAESSLTSLLAELRGALGDDARHPRFMCTVRGFGYSFCSPTTDAGRPCRTAGQGKATSSLLSGPEVALRPGENVLGRDDDVVAWLDSPTVSRRHARILVSDGRATLEDLGSRNGTYLRGERIPAPALLVDSDEIRIGRVFLTFRSFPVATSTKSEEG